MNESNSSGICSKNTLELIPQRSDDPATLELADLVNACRIFDYCAAEGAFKGWDVIEKVIQTRNRLQNFVNATQQRADASAETSVTPETNN